MRLHRGGDRQANRALHLIAVCRLRYDQRTRDHAARRLAEGLSKKDILRCLKRFIAREVYNDLRHDLTALDDLVSLGSAGPGLAGRVGVGRSAVVVTHDESGPSRVSCL